MTPIRLTRRQQVGLARLEKLERHIRRGKLAHESFDFGAINEGSPDGRSCGTSGCAMGEMPKLWPRYWGWDNWSVEPADGVLETSVERFFRITEDACWHLFYPHNQRPDEFGGDELSGFCSRRQVADNMREFIRRARRTGVGMEG